MKIGELVERLIYLRDCHKYDLDRSEDRDLCEAINLLDRLPRMEEVSTYGTQRD